MKCSREMSESSDTVKAIADRVKCSSPQVGPPAVHLPAAWADRLLMLSQRSCPVQAALENQLLWSSPRPSPLAAHFITPQVCDPDAAQTSGEVSFTPQPRGTDDNCSLGATSYARDRSSSRSRHQAPPNPPIALSHSHGQALPDRALQHGNVAGSFPNGAQASLNSQLWELSRGECNCSSLTSKKNQQCSLDIQRGS